MLGRFFQKEQDDAAADNLDQTQQDPRMAAAAAAHATEDAAHDDESRLSFMMNSDDDRTVDTTNSGLLMDMVKNNFLSDLQAENDSDDGDDEGDAPTEPPSSPGDGNGDDDTSGSYGVDDDDDDDPKTSQPGERWGGWIARRSSLNASSHSQQQQQQSLDASSHSQREGKQDQDQQDQQPKHDEKGDTTAENKELETPRRRKWGWAAKAAANETSEDNNNESPNETPAVTNKDDDDRDDTAEPNPIVATVQSRYLGGWGRKGDRKEGEEGSDKSASGSDKSASGSDRSGKVVEQAPIETPNTVRRRWGWSKQQQQDAGESPAASTEKTPSQRKRLGWGAKQETSENSGGGNDDSKKDPSVSNRSLQSNNSSTDLDNGVTFGQASAANTPTADEQEERASHQGRGLDEEKEQIASKPSDTNEDAPKAARPSLADSKSETNSWFGTSVVSIFGGEEDEPKTEDKPKDSGSWFGGGLLGQDSNPVDTKKDGSENQDEKTDVGDRRANLQRSTSWLGSVLGEDKPDEKPAEKQSSSWLESVMGSEAEKSTEKSETTDRRADLKRSTSWLESVMGEADTPAEKEPETTDRRSDVKRSPSWLESVMGEVDKQEEEKAEKRPELARSNSWLGSVLGQNEDTEPAQLTEKAETASKTTSWLDSAIGEGDKSTGTTITSQPEAEPKDRRQELKRSKSWLESLMGEEESPESVDQSGAPPEPQGDSTSEDIEQESPKEDKIAPGPCAVPPRNPELPEKATPCIDSENARHPSPAPLHNVEGNKETHQVRSENPQKHQQKHQSADSTQPKAPVMKLKAPNVVIPSSFNSGENEGEPSSHIDVDKPFHPPIEDTSDHANEFTVNAAQATVTESKVKKQSLNTTPTVANTIAPKLSTSLHSMESSEVIGPSLTENDEETTKSDSGSCLNLEQAEEEHGLTQPQVLNGVAIEETEVIPLPEIETNDDNAGSHKSQEIPIQFDSIATQCTHSESQPVSLNNDINRKDMIRSFGKQSGSAEPGDYSLEDETSVDLKENKFDDALPVVVPTHDTNECVAKTSSESSDACRDQVQAKKRFSWMSKSSDGEQESEDSIIEEDATETEEDENTNEQQQESDRRSGLSRSDSWLGSILGDTGEKATAEPSADRRAGLARSDSWLGSIMGESAEDTSKEKVVQDEGLAMKRSDSWLGSILGESSPDLEQKGTDKDRGKEENITEDRRQDMKRSDSWLGSILGESEDVTDKEQKKTADSKGWLGSVLTGDENPKGSNQNPEEKAESIDSEDKTVKDERDEDKPKSDRDELQRANSWYGSLFGENGEEKQPGQTNEEDQSGSPPEQSNRDNEHEENGQQPSDSGDGKQSSWLESVFGEEEKPPKESTQAGDDEGENPPVKKPLDRRAGLQRSNSWLESVLAEGADPTASDFQEKPQAKDRRGELKRSKSWLESIMDQEEDAGPIEEEDKTILKKPTENLRAELKRSQSWFESKDMPLVVDPSEEDMSTDGLFHHADDEMDEGENDFENDPSGQYVSRFDGLRKLSLFRALESASFKELKSETVIAAPITERDHGNNRLLAIAKAILGDEIAQPDPLFDETEEGMDIDVPDYLREDVAPTDSKTEDSTKPQSVAESDDRLVESSKPSAEDSATTPRTEEPDVNKMELSGQQRWRKWFGAAKPTETLEPTAPIDVEDDQLESSASEVSESDPSLSTGVLESEINIKETSNVTCSTSENDIETSEKQDRAIGDRCTIADKDERVGVIETTHDESKLLEVAPSQALQTESSNPQSHQSSERKQLPSEKGNLPQPSERGTLDTTAELVQSLTTEQMDLIAGELMGHLQQSSTENAAPTPQVPPQGTQKRRRKKGSIGALLEQIPSGKLGRHGDEVSVGALHVRRPPNGRTTRDVVVPRATSFQFDEQSAMASNKKHPWENALKEASKKSSSTSGTEEEEDLKQIEILGKADEFFGLRPNLNSNSLPALTEEEDSSGEEDSENEENEDADDLAALADKSDLEKQLEREKEVQDFEDMWDNVSCDEEIAIEFEKKKRKKNHEKEKRRQKLEREREDNADSNKRIRLFEKPDRSIQEKRVKAGKATKLSEELVEALQKVFDEGSENSWGSGSDDDGSDDFLDGSGNQGSCRSLYIEEEKTNDEPAESPIPEEESVKGGEMRKSDGRSKPLFGKITTDEIDEPQSPESSKAGKAKKSRKAKSGGRKKTKRQETDASEMFMKEISKLKQPKVLTIGSLRQEMIDRRGTTANLLKKEYVTFRKKRNDKKGTAGYDEDEDEEDDEIRPLDFGVIARRKSSHHVNTSDDIFGGTSAVASKKSSIGLGETLSRWASEEGVSVLDDLATVNEHPVAITNMFGVVQAPVRNTNLAPPLRVPTTPKGPRTYGNTLASPITTGISSKDIRPMVSTRNMGGAGAGVTQQSSRPPYPSSPVRKPRREMGGDESSANRMDMFTANFGVAESTLGDREGSDNSEGDFGLLAQHDKNDGDKDDDDDDRSYFSSSSKRSAGGRKRGFGLGKKMKQKLNSMKIGGMRTRGRNSGAGMMLNDDDW